VASFELDVCRFLGVLPATGGGSGSGCGRLHAQVRRLGEPGAVQQVGPVDAELVEDADAVAVHLNFCLFK
jgi:hypothetical protein